MKIISWNCHYGFTKDKQDRIREFARKHDDADIYLIQEAKENDIINLEEFTHRHWYGDHAEFGDCHKPRANSGDLGIAIMSTKYKIQRIDEGRERYRYVLPYRVYSEDEEYIIFNVWTKAFNEFYFEAIEPALNYYSDYIENNQNVIMMGDFNFGVDFHNKFFETFDSKINKYNLEKPYDIIEKQNTNTYYSSKDKKYFFNDCLYHSAKVKVKDYKVGETKDWIENGISDHCPVYVEIEIQKSR